jgi:cephalosporin hydroxylase
MGIQEEGIIQISRTTAREKKILILLDIMHSLPQMLSDLRQQTFSPRQTYLLREPNQTHVKGIGIS